MTLTVDLLRARRWPGVPALRALPAPGTLLVAAAAGFLLGGLTSYGQTVLPDAVSSVANSSTGWTLAVVLVIALLRPRTWVAALAGPVCFEALVLGYQVVSTLRGYPDSEWFFLAAGLVVGPFVGVATVWLRARGIRPALAAGLLAGIAIGEGSYGLTVIADSTSPVYWTLDLVAGIGLLVITAVRHLDRWWQTVLAVLVTLVVATAFLVAYTGGNVVAAVL